MIDEEGKKNTINEYLLLAIDNIRRETICQRHQNVIYNVNRLL